MRKRHVFLLAVVGMIVAACMPNGVDNVSLNSKAVPVIIRAEQIVEGETKTVRNADKSVSWLGGEEINVICGADRAKFTSTNTDAAAVVSFSGSLTEATVNAVNNGTSTYPVWGLYPYDENVESDGETYVTTTLPAAQTGVAGTFADDLFITLAKSDNFNLSFYNVCSGFKFTVTKAGITSISIQGKNDEYIAGKVKLTFDGEGKPKVDEVINGQKTITLTPPEKSTFEVGKDYYFVTLPIPFTSGFTVTFNTPSETGLFDVATSVTFPRSKFVTKANVDENIVYGAKAGNIIIPDANFKAYCVANFDTNEDGEISYNEALLVNKIKVRTDNILSLSGIEFFSNLQSLDCSGSSYQYVSEYGRYIGEGKLTSLDITNNIFLVSLFVSANRLTTLDLSQNQLLKTLDCSFNSVSNLNVRNNTQLTYLECLHNLLQDIDVSNNVNLFSFSCADNKIRDINVRNNPQLNIFDCSNNQLTSIDVNNNLSLSQFNCNINQLESINISENTALTLFNCSYNQLSSLDISLNKSLRILYCQHNQLEQLNVCNNSALSALECNNNKSTLVIYHRKGQLFTFIDYDASATFVESGEPIPDGNVLFEDDNFKSSCLIMNDLNDDGEISYAEALLVIGLGCDNSSIQSLSGIAAFKNLVSLSCSSNILTSIDVSNNLSLQVLLCDYNQLSSLDVSKNSLLRRLDCLDNPSLSEIWLKTGQTISTFNYDSNVTTVKYKE